MRHDSSHYAGSGAWAIDSRLVGVEVCPQEDDFGVTSWRLLLNELVIDGAGEAFEEDYQSWQRVLCVCLSLLAAKA
jgi:hypothetical protein